jgi:hypothetical protein
MWEVPSNAHRAHPDPIRIANGAEGSSSVTVAA